MTSMALPTPDLGARLVALEEELGPRHSLAPGRARATTFPELGTALSLGTHPHDVAAVAGLEDVARSVARAFPSNLFADLDLLARELVELARTPSGPSQIAELVADLVTLHDRFGRPPLRFRYDHDFLYGFDWARWVARDPVQRGGQGPYGRRFVARMLSRGEEIIRLVQVGDRDYPRLPEGAYRNPFGFVREPAEEARLLQELARRGQIPVPAWDLDARPDWRPDYARLRRELAAELGLVA